MAPFLPTDDSVVWAAQDTLSGWCSTCASVAALGADGKPVKVRWEMDGKHAVLLPESAAVQLGAEIDEGYWCKTTEGWKNKSRREIPDALASEWSLSYSKVLLKPKD